MLAWLYVEAFRQTRQQRFATVARGIFDFILREMTGSGGEFFTAIDAEVDGMEGQSYLWTPAEVDAVLSADDARLFNRVYALDDGPNFVDPHHGKGAADRNVLHRPQDPDVTARELGLAPADLESLLANLRQKLLVARHQRKQPILDTKVLTSWNGLMIRALAYGGNVLSDSAYLAAAERAADWLLAHHRDPAGALVHSSRDGKTKPAVFLDDYAMLIQALLSLEAAGNSARRDQAEELADRMLKAFGGSPSGALYFTGPDTPDLAVRQIVGSDSPLPSGNAVAASALIAMGRPEAAWDVIRAFAGSLAHGGDGMAALLRAAWLYVIRFGATGVEIPRQGAAAVDGSVQYPPVYLSAKWIDPKLLRVTAVIKPGHHINAAEAKAGLVATRLIVGGDSPTESAAITDAIERINYPPGVKTTFTFTDEPMVVYDDRLEIDVAFKAPAPASWAIVLRLRYQACTSSECLLPATAQFRVAGH